MSLEVEMKFRVENHEALAKALEARGAAPGPESAQADLYLAHPSRDFAQTDEALRLRQDGQENRITYKGPKRGGPTKTREEIEVPFESGPEAREDMARVFERLGFRRVLDVRKHRIPYHVQSGGRDFEVTLDRAEGLGAFAEVEAIARDEADLASVQEAVQELASELGLTEKEPRSYLRMALEARQEQERKA